VSSDIAAVGLLILGLGLVAAFLFRSTVSDKKIGPALDVERDRFKWGVKSGWEAWTIRVQAHPDADLTARAHYWVERWQRWRVW
jgi:hypothetical protein